MQDTDILDQITNKTLHNIEISDTDKPEDKSDTIDAKDTEIWTKVLELLSKKLKKPSFETWIKPNFLLGTENEFALISVRNDFTRNFLLQSFAKNIQDALKEVTGKAMALRFVINNTHTNPFESFETEETEASVKEEAYQIKLADLSKEQAPQRLEPVSKLNFNNYISTEVNKSAINFSKAIIENASGIYKSLVIYAGSGLGKTHLLQAVFNEVKVKDHATRIKYVNGEKFTNELIIAIQRNETFRFRQNYRNIDILVFDDLNFLDNKKSCQDELCYTLESILNNGGRFISSSSKRLSEFKTLNPKLKSLLQAALVAEIGKPQIKDKADIIRYKASKLQLNLQESHIQQLAERAVDGVREIEGFLFQLSAEINLNHLAVDDELISEAFGGIFNNSPNLGMSLEKISETVSSYFGIEEKDLLGLKRSKEFMQARHIAVYLSYDLLEISYGRIGDHFSNRKHSSIIHSINTVKTTLKSPLPSSKATEKIITDIRQRLSAK